MKYMDTIISPILQMSKWGTEGLSNMPKVTELVSDGDRLDPRQPESKAHTDNHCLVPPWGRCGPYG